MIVEEGCERSVKNVGLTHETTPPAGRGIRAIAAFSGGLDSQLAALLVRRAGVDVTLLHVQHLWSGGEATQVRLRAAAERLAMPLVVVDATDEHLDVVRHPKHGYGVGVNPCVDCHVFMLRIARRVMEEEGAQFVVTGEVLGQRPKSQHYRALLDVAAESGLGDLLVRPLSANLLPETLPVRRGWLRREDLRSLQGRGREPQLTLAAEFGLRDVPQSAGGCLLAERAYAARVRAAFGRLGVDGVDRTEFERLRVGRHFRLSDRAYVVIGRDEGENARLAGLAAGVLLLEPLDVLGPTALIEGDPSDDELRLGAALVARYADHEGRADVRFAATRGSERWEISVPPLDPTDPRIDALRVGPR
ncbi:MAG: hypothetical protein AB1778_07160 [Candidatus Bipolaricaulota bacterium]